ncbi:hypothetical protein BJ122_1099 [Rhodopseudomonas faecalis]|uniref:Nutrient deprivation-induced protein n=1 Tax=Rhodopseudomonas faecalis TaxID=99655 RepID=A0A318TT93_9BRAD|nr:YtxH domain-containing protein [Rhodopseudomonas faecalis]PYF02879.1 hypothetical protein BJ122_1099 [Rhodopseudomonas faecalis]
MAEINKGSVSGTSAGGTRGTKTLRGASEEVVGEAREFRDKISDTVAGASSGMRQQAAEFTDAAKDVASQAGERVKEQLSDQAGAGADYVDNIADTMRRAAREFDAELPIAATMIRRAASKVESLSDTVRGGDLQDLISGAQRFARAQPAAFFGIAVLAGFGAVRFLKSTAANDGHHVGSTQSEGGSHAQYRAGEMRGA